MPKIKCIRGESTKVHEWTVHLVIFYSKYYAFKNILLLRLLYHDSFALIHIGVPKKPCTLKNSMIKKKQTKKKPIVLVGKGLVLESVKLEMPIS